MNAKLYNTVHICKQNRQKVTRNVFYEQITVYSETAHLKNRYLSQNIYRTDDSLRKYKAFSKNPTPVCRWQGLFRSSVTFFLMRPSSTLASSRIDRYALTRRAQKPLA